jgi:hypothetical protein
MASDTAGGIGIERCELYEWWWRSGDIQWGGCWSLGTGNACCGTAANINVPINRHRELRRSAALHVGLPIKGTHPSL